MLELSYKKRVVESTITEKPIREICGVQLRDKTLVVGQCGYHAIAVQQFQNKFRVKVWDGVECFWITITVE